MGIQSISGVDSWIQSRVFQGVILMVLIFSSYSVHDIPAAVDRVREDIHNEKQVSFPVSSLMSSGVALPNY